MTDFTLADLAKIVARRAQDTASSYTAKLLADGVERCARKFGEEAVEAVLAAAVRDRKALTHEAADVLYHLLVMLEAGNVRLSSVMAELKKRTAQSGVAEKAGRKRKAG